MLLVSVGHLKYEINTTPYITWKVEDRGRRRVRRDNYQVLWKLSKDNVKLEVFVGSKLKLSSHKLYSAVVH